MENSKPQNIRFLSPNQTENELFKQLDEYTIPQGADINILSEYYNKKKGNNEFVDKISKLNKKFFLNSDNYIKSKKKLDKLNDDLYMNLFKQINCYVEEIEKLNKKIALNNNQDLKKTIEQLNKEITEKKEKIRNYEVKLKEKTENEEKLKKEIESYKRRIIFYKDKIKIGLLPRNRNAELKIREDSSYLTNQKKYSKKNNIFASSDKKINIFFDKNINNKDLSHNLIDTIDNKEEITMKIREKNISENNKRFKLKESTYLLNEDNYPKHSGNFNNRYDNDILEQNEQENDLNYNFEKTNSKSNNELLKIKINSENYSHQNSNNFSQKSLELIKKEKSANSVNEEKIENVQNLDEKNKTFDETNKVYDNQLKKNNDNGNNNYTYKKNEIKSKILNNKKNYKDKIIHTDNNMTEKNKKLDIIPRTKPLQKNNYIISKFQDSSYTPITTAKYHKKFIADKIRPSSIKKNIGRYTKNENNNNSMKKGTRGKIKSNDLNNSNNNKTYNSINKLNQPVIKNKIINRKIKEKENNKDMNLVLKIVNDDYLNSIDMLKKQEEQIKNMLNLLEK